MRWWPLIALAGCVPISASEYAGGNRTDTRDGEPSELDGAEDTPEATMDAAVEDEPTTAVDADGQPSLDDAGDAEAPTDEAADASGSERPVVSCATDGVFCEDFERYPTCPDVPGPSWDYCEHIGNDTGPAREGLADNGGFALRTRISADAGVRSQRLVREVPLDADYVEASFWMITDPTDNPWFVWLTLQQEVGRDASGEALGYPGVRLIGTGRRMGVAVQTQQSLSPGDTFYHESDLGPWPEDWIHVLLQVDLVKPSVHVEYHDGSFGPPSPWDLSSYDITNVPVDLQYLALGLYSEAPGAVQMLIDDLQAYAAKDGKIIPLL
jgi:hypothetical protein